MKRNDSIWRSVLINFSFLKVIILADYRVLNFLPEFTKLLIFFVILNEIEKKMKGIKSFSRMVFKFCYFWN